MWLGIVLWPAASAIARDFYISADGDDTTGDGSMAHPWLTIGLVNGLDLEPGDGVWFRRGDVFDGPLLLDAADSATDPEGAFAGTAITLGAYGSGARPRIVAPTDDGIRVIDAAGIEIRDLDLVGSEDPDTIADPTFSTNGILFENDLGTRRLAHVLIEDVVVHGFGEAGVNLRARDPGTDRGGFADVQILRVEAHTNGKHGIVTGEESLSGIVIDGSLPAYQSRVHAAVAVEDCDVHDTTGKATHNGNSGSAVILAQVDGGHVAGNHAYDNGGRAGGGGVAIWTWESTGVVIEDNEAWNNTSSDGRDGGGFDLDGGSVDCVLQYNFSHGNFGAGLGLFEFGYASAMYGNVIRYNVSHRDGGGIAVWGNGPRGDGTTDTAASSLVYSNTIVFPRDPAANLFGSIATVGLYDNALLAFGDQAVVQETDFDGAGTGFVIDVELSHNAYATKRGAMQLVWDGVGYATVRAWARATGQEMEDGRLVALVGNPGLHGPLATSGPGNGPASERTLRAYRLRRRGRGIDRGVDVAQVSRAITLGLTDTGARDFFGGPIPRGRRFDIGANERR